METLIDSLLHYSRLGRTDLALDEVDVQEVVDDVVDRLGISLREQHVEVRIPRRLPVIQSDRVRLGGGVRQSDHQRDQVQRQAAAVD